MEPEVLQSRHRYLAVVEAPRLTKCGGCGAAVVVTRQRYFANGEPGRARAAGVVETVMGHDCAGVS